MDLDRLRAAYLKARDDLLSQRGTHGHWEGRLASSPLSTATAISALVLAEHHGRRLGQDYILDEIFQNDLSEQVVQSLHWLAEHQNQDGGWGDTDRSRSNIATTMLVQAAFHLTGVPAKFADLLARSEAYVQSQGGIAGLRKRYGRDRTFAVPILTNCALAGLVSWKHVPALPFELACLPQSFYRFLRLPVVSYAIPALVAIGQAKFYHQKPLNPIMRRVRARAVEPSLKVLRRMQPESGGYLEATPLTSFVVMSLASIGRADHPVTRAGVEFLLASVRSDGSWPIDTNLATWNTTLTLNALAGAGEPVEELGCLDWVLGCQQQERHAFTAAEPGGWAWTDLSGGVPDADDTPGALLCLRSHLDQADPQQKARIEAAALGGVGWLLDLQNRDGGWPTFCRGWGKLPFDRSGADLTAHALRALTEWRDLLPEPRPADTFATGRREARSSEAAPAADWRQRIDQAIERGLGYLQDQQRGDGSWVPLWFGNQHFAEEENPIYGTARVLMCLRDLGRMQTPSAQQGLQFLASVQQPDGGWGGGPAAAANGYASQASTVEETALATEALLAAEGDPQTQVIAEKGLGWLMLAEEEGRFRNAAPIGFYFAKLWYYEDLYPLIFTVAALGRAWALKTSHDRSPAKQITPLPQAAHT